MEENCQYGIVFHSIPYHALLSTDKAVSGAEVMVVIRTELMKLKHA